MTRTLMIAAALLLFATGALAQASSPEVRLTELALISKAQEVHCGVPPLNNLAAERLADRLGVHDYARVAQLMHDMFTPAGRANDADATMLYAQSQALAMNAKKQDRAAFCADLAAKVQPYYGPTDE